MALLSCSCGGSGGVPTAPAATVVAVSISPATDVMKLAATERWGLNATLSSGAVQSVAATWASDTPAVATVDSSGTVTAVAAGRATIAAEYQGQRATRSLRVVPDYGGHWDGLVTVTSCQVQGDFQGEWCRSVQGAAAIRLDLIQTRDFLSGTYSLLDSTGTVDGAISTPGVLSLSGTIYRASGTITIADWESVSVDNRAMTGHFALVWTVPGLAGSARVELEITNCRKP